MISLVSTGRAPPRRTRNGADYARCSCGHRAAEVLRAYGVSTLDPRTPEQWTRHLAEEAPYLAALRAVGAPASEVDRLEAEHAYYEVLLSGGVALPTGDDPFSVDAHGALEDDLAEEFRAALLDRAGVSLTTSGTSLAFVRAAGTSSSPLDSVDYGELAKTLEQTAASDVAARAKRTKETEAQIDDLGRAVDRYTGVPIGSWLAGASKLALGVVGTVVRWVQGDWNSDEQKQRALDAVRRSIEGGILPKPFDAEEDFAKTYADSVEADLSRVGNLESPWSGVFGDYRSSLLANAGDPLVTSIFPGTDGYFSLEFGPPFLCGAIGDSLGKNDPHEGLWTTGPGWSYALANLVAAVARARFGGSIEPYLRKAYAALPVVYSVHPTICSGRGYKGDADTWDYDMGPILYVVQAWLAVSPSAHAEALEGKAPVSSDPYAGKLTAPKSGSVWPWLALAGAGVALWRYSS